MLNRQKPNIKKKLGLSKIPREAPKPVSKPQAAQAGPSGNAPRPTPSSGPGQPCARGGCRGRAHTTPFTCGHLVLCSKCINTLLGQPYPACPACLTPDWRFQMTPDGLCVECSRARANQRPFQCPCVMLCGDCAPYMIERLGRCVDLVCGETRKNHRDWWTVYH